MGAFNGNIFTPKTNPYCDETKTCPRRTMSSYLAISAEFSDNPGMAGINAMLDFACVLNPKNNNYCTSMMDKGEEDNSPWGKAACKADWDADFKAIMGDDDANPPLAPVTKTAPAASAISAACKASMVSDATFYGCCVEEITDFVKSVTGGADGAMQKAWM